MRFVDSNIIISNLIGDNRLGKASEKYLEYVASGKESAVTSVHTMIEVYAFIKGKRLSEQRIAEILKDVNMHGITLLPFEPAFLLEAISMAKIGWNFDNLEDIKRIDILEIF